MLALCSSSPCHCCLSGNDNHKKERSTGVYCMVDCVKWGIFPQEVWVAIPQGMAVFPCGQFFLLNLALFSCDCMQEGDGSRDCDLHVDNILFAPGLMCVYAIACMCLCVCVCVCVSVCTGGRRLGGSRDCVWCAEDAF